MLYLMLVVVFSKLAKKWWFFMLLGWGIYTCVHSVHCLSESYFMLVPALVPVIVGLAARHKEYGIENNRGDLE